MVRECKIRREWMDLHRGDSIIHDSKRPTKRHSSSTMSSLASFQSVSTNFVSDVIDYYSDEDSDDNENEKESQCRVFAIKIINKDSLDRFDLAMLETEVAFLRQVEWSQTLFVFLFVFLVFCVVSSFFCKNLFVYSHLLVFTAIVLLPSIFFLALFFVLQSWHFRFLIVW